MKKFSLTAFVREYLDPAERIGEILFGLIMVLTFTLAAKLTIREEGPEAVSQLLIATVGCNLAWGIIDSAMYLMALLLEKSRRAQFVKAVQGAPDEAAATNVIHGALEQTFPMVGTEHERRDLYRNAYAIIRQVAPERVRLTRDDILGAFACFLLVVVSTLPAAIPFLLFDEPFRALRVSNALLLVMLFGVGYAWGKEAHLSRWLSGFAFLTAGTILVAVAIRLGG